MEGSIKIKESIGFSAVQELPPHEKSLSVTS